MRSPSNKVAYAAAPSSDRLRYPFTLGVASGDPTPGGVVLWTRLAPEPEQDDGGMPLVSLWVRWEIARDHGFRHVVCGGTSLAHPELAHSVHVEVAGLVPGAVYWYRFLCAGHESQVGCTRTAPEVPGHYESVRFAVTSGHDPQAFACTGYDAIAREDLDFVLFVGDYLGPIANDDDRSAQATESERARMLTAFRRGHSARKRDPHLQSAHRALPWRLAGDPPTPRDARTRSAWQALWEHMPLRRARRSSHAASHAVRPRSFLFGDLLELRSASAASREPGIARRMTAVSPARWQLWVRSEPLPESSSPCDEAARRARNLVHLSCAAQESALNLVSAPAQADHESPVAPQLVVSSISAQAQPSTRASQFGAHALFRDARAGYLRCELDREAFHADFLVLPQTTAGALTRCASYVIEHGRPLPRKA